MNGMGSIVKSVTRVTVGVIFMFGCYVSAQGFATIGGGLAGGVVIALSLMLYVLAFGSSKAEERLSKRLALIIMESGAAFLLLFFVFGGGLDPKFECVLSNFAVGVTVGSGLFVVFLNMTTFRVKIREEK
jgi:multisubunit Na+/H+ antiporter MnhB subunit